MTLIVTFDLPLTWVWKTLTWPLIFYRKGQGYYISHVCCIKQDLSVVINLEHMTFDLQFWICQILMTTMKAKSIIPFLCHLHLSRQHIMISLVSLYWQTVSSHFQRKINTGRHVLLLFPWYFSIINIKYHLKMSPLALHVCIPWNSAYIVMYIQHLIMTLPKITFWPIQKGSHRTFAAGVDSRQGHSLLWTANSSSLGLA